MVLNLPRLNLIEPCANSTSNPPASNTYEGSRLPVAQAEPVETAIPSISKYNKMDSPSALGKEQLSVPGRQCS